MVIHVNERSFLWSVGISTGQSSGLYKIFTSFITSKNSTTNDGNRLFTLEKSNN